MRVGIVQSSYIPWRGYFDFIASVDLFILLDDVPFSQRPDWRKRNRVKTRHGLRWLTVPVTAKGPLLIDQVLISDTGKSWRNTHHAVLSDSFSPCPYRTEALEIWQAGVVDAPRYLSQLNRRLTEGVCDYLQIKTPLVDSRDLGATGAKTQRLLNLLTKVGATRYLSGPVAKDYLDEQLFREAAIALEYKTYDYPSYPQPWGSFTSAVTVLDLIANVGPAAMQYLRSATPAVVAVP